jgi:hypothetical protein
MTMTTVSKVLVVATFIFSVVVAGWSMALYFTRIDWTDTPAKEGQPAGLLVARKARLAEMLADSRPAESSWKSARSLVRDREAFRTGDRLFYQTEITGIYDSPAKQQLHEVVLGPDGQLLLGQDPNNKAHFLPTLRNVNDRAGKPLYSLKSYAMRYAENLGDLKRTGTEFGDLLTKDADLTVELGGGTKSDKTVIEKPLRKRIEDERLKGIDMLAEYEIVRPLLIKTVGDSEFLLARKRQLQERIKKLEETPVSKAQ